MGGDETQRKITDWKKILVSLAGITLAVLLVFPLYLDFAQDELLFQCHPIDGSTLKFIGDSYPQAQEIAFRAPDGTKLRGWLQKGAQGGRAPLLIFFGGNAEEVSYVLPELDKIPAWSVLLVNYRCYGLSEGTPSEEKLFSDAKLLYDEIIKRPDVDPARIAVMGRSLGTGVAVYLASQRSVAGVVLASPYDSLDNVAQRVYPFVPVSLFLKHHFNSAARAPYIHAPLLALIAANDILVPPSFSRRLVGKWGGSARVEVLDGVDHNTITLHTRFWGSVFDFLRRLQ